MRFFFLFCLEKHAYRLLRIPFLPIRSTESICAHRALEPPPPPPCRMVRDAHMPQLVKALRQLGLNTPGLKWKMVDEASIGGVCICDKCEIECIQVWGCKECEERETEGEGQGFVLCKKCYASLRSGDGSVLHNAGHTFEFHEKGHGEGEVMSEALASALQDKMAFTRQELDSFKLPTLSYHLVQRSSSTTSYIRTQTQGCDKGTCYRPAHNSLTLSACKLTVAGYKQLAAFLVLVHPCQMRPSIQVKETYNRGTGYRQLGAFLYKKKKVKYSASSTVGPTMPI